MINKINTSEVNSFFTKRLKLVVFYHIHINLVNILDYVKKLFEVCFNEIECSGLEFEYCDFVDCYFYFILKINLYIISSFHKKSRASAVLEQTKANDIRFLS